MHNSETLFLKNAILFCIIGQDLVFKNAMKWNYKQVLRGNVSLQHSETQTQKNKCTVTFWLNTSVLILSLPFMPFSP